MIEIKKVTKTYNNKIKAIRDLSLDIPDGKIIGFIGLNGAGKTTLIKMMTGILKPDKGSIIINGLDIAENPIEVKQDIGYITDNPDMFLRLTGIEFINFISDIYNIDEKTRKERISYLTKEFELTDILDKPMQGYSHGMKQKMMVVAALVHSPKVWILDEPMVGLDPKSALVLKKMMKEHAKNGNTVFFSTHVLEVAEKLCDEIAIIDEGKIIYYGTLDDLSKKYNKKNFEELFLEVLKNE
jgi:ABC-2 type transport system ATP-binding protein